jgi:hypothetical protein
MYIYQKENNTKSSCIINSNIIYLLKNSLIGHGNLSKGEGGQVYEALSPKFDGVY